jgi:hypothetical protein
MLVSEDFSCSTWPSSSATQQQYSGLDYFSPPATTQQVKWRTFILVAERLVPPHQVVALCLHVLDIIVVLGKGGVKL